MKYLVTLLLLTVVLASNAQQKLTIQIGDQSSGTIDFSQYLKVYDAAATYQPKGNYLTSYTETDEVFKASVAATITATDKANYQTAFSWGNHAGLYPSLTGSYANPSWIASLPYSKITGAPDLSSYLTQSLADARYAIAGQPGTIPIASTTTIGGVKPGTGLTVDANGTLNVVSNQTPVSASWGTITGTVSSQADLQSAFNTKVDKVTGKALSTNDFDNTQVSNLSASFAHISNTNNPHATTKVQVGLGNVDNTSDATKNTAVATLTNKTLVSPAISSPTGLTKTDVGLSKVDNTADTSKPVSNAVQAALNLKISANNATLTGVPTAPTPPLGTNTNQIATAALVVSATAAKQASITASGILKGTGSSVTSATAGSDYMTPSGTQTAISSALDTLPSLSIKNSGVGTALMDHPDSNTAVFKGFLNAPGYTVVQDGTTGFHLNISGTGSSTQNTDTYIKSVNAFGSPLKGQSIGQNPLLATGAKTLGTQTLLLCAVYVDSACTLSGAMYYNRTQAVYTPAATGNRVGLYTQLNGVLTLVASSADKGTMYSAPGNNTYVQVPFTTPYVCKPGGYYLGYLYNSSASTYVPQMLATQPPSGASSQANPLLSNNNKLTSVLPATSLPTSINMSTPTISTAQVWTGVY